MSNQFVLPCRKRLSFTEINAIDNLQGRVRDVVEYIEKNTILREIVVDSSLHMADSSKNDIFTAILYNPLITSIKIEGVRVDKHVASWIARFRRMECLERLVFQGFVSIPNRGDERSIAYMLQTNATLRELSLFAQYTDVTRAFLDALAQKPQLQSSWQKLSVKCCNLNHACYLAIAQVLENHLLLKLDVREMQNELLPNSAASRIAEGIEKCPSLVSVSIRTRRILASGAERILTALSKKPGLKNVYVGNVRASTPFSLVPAVTLLETCQSIATFSLSCGRWGTQASVSDAFGRALATNECLKDLLLDGFAIDAKGIQSICNGVLQSDTLESLCLPKSGLDERCMPFIFNLILGTKTLKKLDLSYNAFSSAQVDLLCESMENNESIDYLALHGCSFSDTDVARIGRLLLHNTTLKSLNLGHVRGLTEPSVRSLIEGVKVHPAIVSIQLLFITMVSGDSKLLRQELDFYLELNRGPKCLLASGDSTLPMGLWPLALKRAADCQRGLTSRPPNVLYYLVKEKNDAFCVGRRKQR